MASRRSSIVPFRPSRARSYRSRARYFRSRRRKQFPLAAPLLVLAVAFFGWALFAPQAPAIVGALWSSVSHLVATGDWAPPDLPQPVPSSSSDGTLSGRASVIDADTIEIRDTRIRFHAIDAPESEQHCYVDGSPQRCGQRAANALRDWIAGRTVTCIELGTDPYKRIIAMCSVGGTDVERWLVRNGYAVAYRDFSDEYVCDEAAAARAGRGIWATDFVKPSQWRRLSDEARDDAPISGYDPGWPWYCW